MPENNSLIWIVVALLIIFEIEILILGSFWLIKNHRRRDKLDEMRKKKQKHTYSFAPALLFTLPAIFSDFKFQVAAIVVLVAAIFFVTIFHLHCLWKREAEDDALISTDEVEEEEYQSDENVSIAVEQQFALEVEEGHPLSVKIPICGLSVDEDADAEHGLIVDGAKHEPIKPVPIMNWRGELTRKIWPILITNCRGKEIGEIQPIIVENRDDDLVKPIRPLKVDNSKGTESQPLVATRIKNQRGETVGFIKPIIVENTNGKMIGSAKAPIVMNEAEELIGVARPIVVIDSSGTVLGTVAPSVTYDPGKDSPMQSVVLFHAEGEVSIPLRSVAVTDVKDMSDVVLPKVIVSNAKQDENMATGDDFIVTKVPVNVRSDEQNEEKVEEETGVRTDNTAATKAEKAAARKAEKTDKAAGKEQEITETAQEQEPIADQLYELYNDEPEYVDEIEVEPAASSARVRETNGAKEQRTAAQQAQQTQQTQPQRQTLQFAPAAKRQAAEPAPAPAPAANTPVQQPVRAQQPRSAARPAPATNAPAKTVVQTGYAQDPDDVYEGDIEEVRITNEATGDVTVIRYNKSFTAKLIQSSEEIKAWYGRLKNEFLSYDRVWSRVWWSHDNVNVSRIGIAKFVIEAGKLYVYMALNPNDFSRQFGVKGADRPRYKKVPCVICIQSDRDVETAIKLIAALAKKFGVTRGETKNENYYLPYETTEALLAENLMQEIYRETTKRMTAKAS